jgi:hypothetical protein
MRSTALRAGALALLACACAPNPPAPVSVMVLVYHMNDKACGAAGNCYLPEVKQLKTVTDVVSMQGSVGNFIGGAKIVLNSSDPAQANAQTEADFLAAAIKKEGGPVNVSYIDKDGTLVPADFHSLNIATTYYNLERSYDFFNRIETLRADQAGTPKVYYWVDFSDEGVPFLDNAAWADWLQGFLIVPYDQLDLIPLSINGGVLGHEYGHFVFNYRVFGKSPFPKIPGSWASDSGATPAANLLDALEEGASDTFGTGITCDDSFLNCDTLFMGLSMNGEDDSRRVDKPHCMDDGLDKMLHTESNDSFTQGCEPFGCNYQLGSVFSSAMWRASQDQALVTALGEGEARKQMFQALWNAEGGGDSSVSLTSWRELIENAGEMNQSMFRLESLDDGKPGVLDAIIDGTDNDLLKKALCSAFLDRFGLTMDQLVRCPATAMSYGECPR